MEPRHARLQQLRGVVDPLTGQRLHRRLRLQADAVPRLLVRLHLLLRPDDLLSPTAGGDLGRAGRREAERARTAARGGEARRGRRQADLLLAEHGPVPAAGAQARADAPAARDLLRVPAGPADDPDPLAPRHAGSGPVPGARPAPGGRGERHHRSRGGTRAVRASLRADRAAREGAGPAPRRRRSDPGQPGPGDQAPGPAARRRITPGSSPRSSIMASASAGGGQSGSRFQTARRPAARAPATSDSG